MSVRSDAIRLVAFVVLALAVLAGLYSVVSNAVGGDSRTYRALFTDASGLRAGDSVRIAGVQVGRVDDTALDGAVAGVTFTVRADQPVFENTRALIRYQDLTGRRYLALAAGAGPARPLDDGATIPVERTEPSLDLSAVFGGFAPLFEVLEPSQVNELAGNIVAVLQGAGPDIGPLLDRTASLTRTIADRDRVLGQVLDGLDSTLSHLATKGPETDELLDRTRALVTGLQDRSVPIFGSLERIRRFAGASRDLLDDSGADLGSSLRGTADAAHLFAANRDDLGATLDGLPGFLGSLARATQYGSWINIYNCASTFGGQSPPDTGPHTEVCR